MHEEHEMLAREADAEDVPAVISLWQRFMTEEHGAVPDADPSAAIKAWTCRLEAQIERGQVIVLKRGAEVVGFVGFIDSADRGWVPSGVAYIVDIYVNPQDRASSAARMLFDELMSRAKRDYVAVWTNTSSENRRVQVLLMRAGFVPMSGFEITGLADQMYFKRQLEDA